MTRMNDATDEAAGKTTWTRLEGTKLWSLAEQAYASPAGRAYHNMDHVRSMYGHAAGALGLPYCANLDLAVLLHDVVIDGRPDAELRSIAWAIEHGVSNPWVHELIAGTVKHAPGADNRLILLDLAGLMDVEVSRVNTRLLRKEAFALNGTSPEKFTLGTTAYLTGLLDRISLGLDDVSDAEDRRTFLLILDGISNVISEMNTEASACLASADL